VPEHIHYDIRFRVTARASGETLAENREIKAGRWIPLSELETFTSEESVLRMARKTIAMRRR
jgi:hypothetical protein